MNNLSIRTLLLKMQSPEKRKTCESFTKVCQLIKDRTGEGNNYIDSYNFCSLLKKRIDKRHCINCKFFKPLS